MKVGISLACALAAASSVAELEAVVERDGANVVAAATGFSDGLVANEYVLGVAAERASALDPGALRAVEWLRRRNARAPEPDRVRFYGLAPSLGAGAVDTVERYLAEVDPELARRAERSLWALAEHRDVDHAGRGIAEVVRGLDARRAQYIATSGRWSYELARQQARVLEQAVALRRAPRQERAQVLERFELENLDWVRRAEGPDARLVIWAGEA